eukprot:COSAG02_NODE_152_length_33208_cov_13.316591_28_plen_48_part_00
MKSINRELCSVTHGEPGLFPLFPVGRRFMRKCIHCRIIHAVFLCKSA